MAKILVIDDEEPMRLIFKAYLTKAGHAIETAADGMEGLEKVASFSPDLILLDINMPRMSGFEVAKKLRDNPCGKTIHIFVISSLKQENNIDRGYELGIEEYITKPFNIAQVKLKINAFLNKKGIK